MSKPLNPSDKKPKKEKDDAVNDPTRRQPTGNHTNQVGMIKAHTPKREEEPKEETNTNG